jgi:hypothetical protein
MGTVLASWHDYFITVAQVSATLAGLLFVGLTISLDHVLAGNGYMSRAFSALFLQFEMLVIGLFGIVPGQPAWVVGLEFIATGIGVFAGTSVFAANFPDDALSVLGARGPRTVRSILATVGELGPVVTGIGLIAGWPMLLYVLIPAQIAALYLSIGNAWVFAVEIPRRMRAQPK